MSVFAAAMFPDTVEVHAKEEIDTKDASGGRVDDFASAVPDVPCSVQPATSEEMAVAGSLGVKLETKVYFRDDPGPMRTGTKIKIQMMGGDVPGRISWLQVQRLTRENLPPLVLWRADCTGRA